MKTPHVFLRLLLLVSSLVVLGLFLLPTQPRPGKASRNRITGASLPAPTNAEHSASRAAVTTAATAPTRNPATSIRDDARAKAAAFDDWLAAWRRIDPSAQSSLLTAGRELGLARRHSLKALLATDPKLALELAVPAGLRAELPAEVQVQLERRIDVRGDLEVTISCGSAGTQIDRSIVTGGTRLAAFVFGRREHQATKHGLPLHGIAIDDVLALDETPYRLLDDGEQSLHGVAADRVAVAIGSEIVTLGDLAKLADLAERLIDAESAPGPHVSLAYAGHPGTPDSPPTAAVTSPPSWINGEKRVLWVQVDFDDDPGAVATAAEIAASNSAVNEFYLANSQGKTSMTFTLLPAVLRLPKDKAYYNTSMSTAGELHTDAGDLARQYDAANGGAGTYHPDRYDRWMVVFKRMPAYTFGGMANIGGPRVWLNGTISAATVAHELGHTQSLNHSHYWLPAGTTAVGPGTHVEYGDVFDCMGPSSATNHFNAAQKAKLGYLEGSGLATVTATGSYRVNRHDHRDASGLRGLKIVSGDLGYEYWVEHRRSGPTSLAAALSDRVRNGALLHWGQGLAPKFTSGPGTYLIDATAGSAGGASDAPLRIGETFVDPDAGLTIKALATGGTAPAEYLDVQVSFGAIDGNRNPTLVAELPAGPLNARTNLVITASATDPDGDPIYYRWDFGDGQLWPSLNSITRRFTKGGTYSLRVSAHDGRGGIAAKTLAVNIVDPLQSWTRRAAGLTTNALYDVAFAGGQFIAVGGNVVLTSPDGLTWTRNNAIPSGNALTGVAHNGARYVLSGYRANAPSDRALAAYSDNGTNWTTVNLPSGTAQLWGIDFGAGRFVTIGDAGTIFSSPDGETWTAATTGVATTLRAVTFADDRFVVVGDAGRVFTSADGLTWTNRSLPTSANFWGAARYNQTWYAIAGATIYSSADGATWSRVTGSSIPAIGTYQAATVGGVYLVGTNNGSIEFTENFQSWSTLQLDATSGVQLRSAAQGQGVIVVVGTSGDIFTASLPTTTSPVLAAPTLRNEADSLKVSVGKKNVLAAGGSGFTKLELYANGQKVSEFAGTSGALPWTPPAIGNYALVVRGITAAGESVTSSAVPAVAGLASWRTCNSAPAATDLRGAVRVGHKWWIVGGCGTFLTLDDAGIFTPLDFPTTQQLNGIAYANGRFVIVCPYYDNGAREEIGSIWTSTDGHAWKPLLTSTLEAATLNFVTFAAGKFVAFGTGGTLMTSTDGLVWARQSSGISTTFRSATHGGGIFVAVASGGRIVTSPDAITWTSRTSGVTTDLYGVTFANGTFVACGLSGVVLTSSEGTTWTRQSAGGATNFYTAGVVKNSFVVAGDSGVVLMSTSGSSWAAASPEGRFSTSLFVAGSGDNGLLLGRAGEAYVATTAGSWRRVNQGTGEARTGVLYAGGRFVAIGQTTDPLTRATATPVMFSSDGVNWTRAAPNTAFTSANVTLNAITYGRATYVAVANTGRIFTSTDANTWVQRTSPITTALYALAASPTGFVAAGFGGAISSSADGITWTTRTSGSTQALRAAAFGNGRFVVAGDNGTVLSSSDGATWMAATSGTTAALQAIDYFDRVGFLAAGNSGTMIRSDDGTVWQPVETGVADTIDAIASTPVGLVATAGTLGSMLVSLDGATWSISTIPADRMIRGLAASSSAIVAVGDNGAMLTFELADTTPPPTINVPPASQSTTVGSSVVLAVEAQNATGGVYQWLKDGAPIVGANSPLYTIPVVSSAHLGTYTVSVATPTGTIVSAPATLGTGAVANPGRLVNLSILTALADASDSFMFGLVVGGTGTGGTKPLLVRAAGPSLTALGVSGVLEDPRLELFTGSTKVGENDNWGGLESARAVMAQVGAFPFSAPTSRDAAISLPSLASGAHSVKISGTGAGLVIAELYDATPQGSFTATTPRLVNVSVLKHLGAGVTAGFVIGGSTPRTLLVRAIGPTLGAAPFNVPEVVLDPQLALFAGQSQIGANDNWGGGSALSTAFGLVGAFGLPTTSRDAALLVTLQPGSYTVQVSGVGGTTGLALVEVYEVP